MPEDGFLRFLQHKLFSAIWVVAHKAGILAGEQNSEIKVKKIYIYLTFEIALPD